MIISTRTTVAETKPVTVPAPVVKVPHLHVTVTTYDGPASPADSAVAVSPTTSDSGGAQTPKSVNGLEKGRVGPFLSLYVEE